MTRKSKTFEEKYIAFYGKEETDNKDLISGTKYETMYAQSVG